MNQLFHSQVGVESVGAAENEVIWLACKPK
jgi:hypothetical protein